MFPSILIVDDEPSILQSLGGLLTDEGFEVIAATNGYEALKIIDAESPDMVLLDIWMPGIDGIETLKEIKKLSKGKLGITLSLGEQSREVYERWFEAGAHRYLLRIESSNPELYQRYHPTDTLHDYARRLTSLKTLQGIGYQTGTGVMIGLPFQKTGDLADDLLFMKEFNIDMVGMGPYIEHKDTPLYAYRNQLLPIEERFDLSLKMIATLRILMKDINIAAATALQAIDPLGLAPNLIISWFRVA